VNTRWSAAEIAYSLDDCDTRVLLVDDHCAPMVADLRATSRSLATRIHLGDNPTPAGRLPCEALIERHTAVTDARRGGKDLAGGFYAGGTTGVPKGVMLSHEHARLPHPAARRTLPVEVQATPDHRQPTGHGQQHRRRGSGKVNA